MKNIVGALSPLRDFNLTSPTWDAHPYPWAPSPCLSSATGIPVPWSGSSPASAPVLSSDFCGSPVSCWSWAGVPGRTMGLTLFCLGPSGTVSTPCCWHLALPTLLTPYTMGLCPGWEEHCPCLNWLPACPPLWSIPTPVAPWQNFRHDRELFGKQ